MIEIANHIAGDECYSQNQCSLPYTEHGSTVLRNVVKAAFVNSVGRLPLSTRPFQKLGCWIRFSRWCITAGRTAGKFRAFPDAHVVKRERLYEDIVRRERLDNESIDFIEFGVFRGESITRWCQLLRHSQTRLVGFDTFTGLPEQWLANPAGTFNTQGKPPTIEDPRCSFHIGLFQDTLPVFLASFQRQQRLILHLDADLYYSTCYALCSMGNLLHPGDLLFFDEFSSPTHEFRAFEEFLQLYRFNHEVLGAVNNFTQVCVRLTR